MAAIFILVELAVLMAVPKNSVDFKKRRRSSVQPRSFQPKNFQRWDGVNSDSGWLRCFFEYGTTIEENTGSLEGAAAVVLSVTQLTPEAWGTIAGWVYRLWPSTISPRWIGVLGHDRFMSSKGIAAGRQSVAAHQFA
jgi:hypothetical protein